MLPLFAITIFLSALLLFMVQPMAAKGILPLLGGSPAVWNTCMVFFQALLLAGYAYAHGLTRLHSRWAQVSIHAVVIMLAAVALPIAVPKGWVAPDEGGQSLWLLGLLAMMVGGPFFVLSTTGPLVQSWFARTGHRSAADPYFLYGASNAGSFIGLLGFPLLVEPILGLRDQGVAWSIGFGLLAPLLIVCGVVMARLKLGAGASADRSAEAPVPAATTLDASPVTWKRRAWWIYLAFVPSSLVLGTTQYLSTDIAAIPLLWVIPLSIYLLTFIIAFARRDLIPTYSLSKLVPFIVVAISVAFMMRARQPITVLIGLHVLMMGLGALLCHKRLAESRPQVSRLTEFYLWIAVGGVLGGIFNALVAPTIFNDLFEYPIAIGLACLARVGSSAAVRKPMSQVLDFAIPVLLIAFSMSVLPISRSIGNALGVELLGGWMIDALRVGIPCLVCFLYAGMPRRFALCALAILSYSLTIDEIDYKTIHKERTFFGVIRVLDTSNGLVRTLRHGTTTHGTQIFDKRYSAMPTTYYHPDGPLGDLMFVYRDTPILDRVAVIGMGTAAIAAYGQDGDAYDFYEIDPAIVRVAQNQNWFTYIAQSRADVKVIVGDGRRKIEEAPDGSYGLIVVDAFSSDAIPVHLVTKEAVEIYRRKLAPGGLIAFHVSNRHIELTPPLVGIANAINMTVVGCRGGQNFHTSAGAWLSVWVVMGRSEEDLKVLLAPGEDRREWLSFESNSDTPVWTDDHANVLEMFKW